MNWNLLFVDFTLVSWIILHFFVLLLLSVVTFCVCVTLGLFLLFLSFQLFFLFCVSRKLHCINVSSDKFKYFVSVSDYAHRPVILIANRNYDPGFVKNILFSCPCFYCLILNWLSTITHIKTKSTIDIRWTWVANKLAVELRVVNVDTLWIKRFLWVRQAIVLTKLEPKQN